jgi:hypothetical protein
MTTFDGDYLDLFRQGPPLVEDFEDYLKSHGFPEAEGRRGWFRATADLLQFPPHLRPRVALSGIHFTLFDPDKKKIPFHRSAAFMVHPAPFRMACLFRNPHCVDVSAKLFDSARALAAGRSSDGGFLKLVQLEHELADTFGLYWSASFDEQGRPLGLPQPGLFPAFPAAPVYGGATVRSRRAFAKGLAARRQHHSMSAPRQLSAAEYGKILAVWDAREGWQGPQVGYDPERAVSLAEAVTATGATKDHYYRAFHLVTGFPYSEPMWKFSFGRNYPAHRVWEHSQRRKAGRGVRPIGSDPVGQTHSPAEDAPDPRGDALQRFQDLVKSGTPWLVAIEQAELPLTDADNLRELEKHPSFPSYLAELLAHALPR